MVPGNLTEGRGISEGSESSFVTRVPMGSTLSVELSSFRPSGGNRQFVSSTCSPVTVSLRNSIRAPLSRESRTNESGGPLIGPVEDY